MEWAIAVIVIVVLGVAALAASGGMGGMSKEPIRDTYRQVLPDTPLGPEDIESLRFGVTLRGYAMGQVDEILNRLAHEIADRDAKIAELSGTAIELRGGVPELNGAVDGPESERLR